MQRRGQTRRHGAGVGDGTPEDAGMQVDGRAVHLGFHAGDAAQTVGEGADAGADHAGVGNGYNIAGQEIAMRFEERLQIGAADFFFTLKKDREIDRQITVF